jgi:hypothetical protein
VPRSDIDERIKEIESGDVLRKEAAVVAEKEYKAGLRVQLAISPEAAVKYMAKHGRISAEDLEPQASEAKALS